MRSDQMKGTKSEALSERLAREACMEGLGHQHIGVERTVAAAICGALDAAAKVARDRKDRGNRQATKDREAGDEVFAMLSVARSDEAEIIAAAIEALKG